MTGHAILGLWIRIMIPGSPFSASWKQVPTISRLLGGTRDQTRIWNWPQCGPCHMDNQTIAKTPHTTVLVGSAEHRASERGLRGKGVKKSQRTCPTGDVKSCRRCMKLSIWLTIPNVSVPCLLGWIKTMCSLPTHGARQYQGEAPWSWGPITLGPLKSSGLGKASLILRKAP